MPQATSQPVFRTLHEIGSEGISFDVPADRQKVLVVLRAEKFEGALVQVPRACRAMVSVPESGDFDDNPPRHD